MAALSAFASFAGSLLLTPFLMFMLCVIFLASIGKSLGVRRLYVSLLLRIFEYGRINIEVAKQRGRSYSSDGVSDLIDDCNDDADECAAEDGKQKSVPYETLSDSGSDGSSLNFNTNSDNILISREAPIMVPNAVGELNSSIDNLNNEKGQGQPAIEFHLSDCLEYIKSGMESIIEDQVTSRFETEELKNWNLLTRTNRHYEFISWRLTVIWVLGFFVRYCFLLPLRILICFVGVMWMIFAFLIISFFPRGMLKRWLNDHAFKITFRILSRSLSTVLTFHNTEFRPKKGGFCVANHTTPIDVVILSTENSFSLVMWLTVCTALVGYMPEGPAKRWMVRKVSIMCFGVLSAALSSVITYHNLENRPLTGICVANHTSPIDVLVLMCDNCYSLIGQRHGGFLGILQRALARASPHIWFERSEVKDRSAVASRLRQHVSDPKNPPILIFPEGTCINNTSVMQFKKGSFEVGGVIYPVAIKYDPKFGDAFWNSTRYSMLQYLYMMMSSWAIVCDVWYLPPMYQQEGESAIDFANRVKSVIARQGGLVDLVWDGQLKRMKPKKEWREKQQEIFSKWLKGGVPTMAED